MENLEEIKQLIIDNKSQFKDFDFLKEEAEFCSGYITALNIGETAYLASCIMPFYRVNKEIFKGIDEKVIYILENISLIDGIDMSNVSNLNNNSEILRRMFINMCDDIRAVFIKLTELLFDALHAERFTKTERFVLFMNIKEVFAPLSARLGLSRIKSMLQDAVVKYFYPEDYKQISKDLENIEGIKIENINYVKEKLQSVLDAMGIKNYEIKSRVKHISSIFNKIKNKTGTINNIYDLLAVRVLVDSKDECYAVLGAVHTEFEPIDSRFKDYIARPKENGYRSIHTTVLIKGAIPVEIQVRTHEMHNDAEYGVCAHFLYKERKNKMSKFDEKLLWLKNLVETGQNISDEEILSEIKKDVYSADIYVYTPMGKILKLEEDSTPIDFAYAIHSEVGNKCVGCKVNGKMTSLNTILRSNDVVEIITSNSSKGPSRDWLKVVKQASTKGKIRSFFKKEMKEENIKRGKQMLENLAKSKNILNLKEILENDDISLFLERLSYNNLDDMFATIGFGGVSALQVLNRLKNFFSIEDKEDKIPEIKDEKEIKELEEHARHKHSGGKTEIIVGGMNNMLLRFAHCCKPIPGDKIVGFFSRGRGVTIHRADCPNLRDLEDERIAPATWGRVESASFPVSIKIDVKNLSRALVDVSTKLNNLKIKLNGITSSSENGINYIIASVLLGEEMQLDELLKKLKGLKEVVSCERYRAY